MSAKVSVFYSKIDKTFPKSSQRFYLAQTPIKNKKTQPKQRLDKLFITKQEQKARNKNKIGLPPNKRYRLTPLARHIKQEYIYVLPSLVGNSSMRHLSPLGISFFLVIIKLLGTRSKNSFVAIGSLMIAKDWDEYL